MLIFAIYDLCTNPALPMGGIAGPVIFMSRHTDVITAFELLCVLIIHIASLPWGKAVIHAAMVGLDHAMANYGAEMTLRRDAELAECFLARMSNCNPAPLRRPWLWLCRRSADIENHSANPALMAGASRLCLQFRGGVVLVGVQTSL